MIYVTQVRSISIETHTISRGVQWLCSSFGWKALQRSEPFRSARQAQQRNLRKIRQFFSWASPGSSVSARIALGMY